MGTERALRIAAELGKPYVGPLKKNRRSFWDKFYGVNLVPGSDSLERKKQREQAPRGG